MNEKFKKFLTSKNISEADFTTKTAQEMGALYNEFYQLELKAIEEKADGKADKKDIPNIEEALKGYLKEDALEAIKTQLSDMTEKVNTILDNSNGQAGNKKGSYVEFVQKNISENKDIENDRNYSANTTIKAAALMTTANVTPNVAGGFSPLFGNYIDTEIGHVPKAEPFILPLVSVTNQPGTESIWYVDRVNEEGDAAFIGEGTLKPLADAEWKTTKAPIVEVAVRWKFTKRLMNHAPGVVSDFYEHAIELVEDKIDDGLVTGTGVAPDINGIATVASAFVAPTALANYYVNANIYDVIMAAATAVRLANFKGQITAVLNTVWMAQMAGIKRTDGTYIVPPFVTPDGKTVGEVKVVFANRMDEDAILVGDLKKFRVVFAENIEYDEGYENDDFSKNLVSRKLEAFLGTYIKDSDAGAIIYDDIATIITAIDAP